MIKICEQDYYANFCDMNDGVGPPALKDECNRLLKCKNRDPTIQIKTSNVLTRMLTELLNDFTDGLSIKSLGLIGILVLMLCCCVCKCRTPSVRRTKDGKIEVNIE